MIDEANVFEVVEWIERAARNANGAVILGDFLAGVVTGVWKTRTTKRISIIRNEGLFGGPLEFVYYLPTKEIQRATRLSDEDLDAVKEFLDTIPQDETMKVEIQQVPDLGETIVLHQYFWVPSDLREFGLVGFADGQLLYPEKLAPRPA